MKSRVGFPLLVLAGALLIVCACTKPPGERRHFRSDQFYLEATLPPGWAAAEEYGPGHERHGLGTLWDQSDCREGDTHPGASVAVTGFAGRAFACTRAPPGSPSDELERSTAVFAGKVTGVEMPGGDVISSADPVRVTFRMYTVWKGPSRDSLTVTTARSTVSCGYEFAAGKEYLVYAYGEEDDLEVSLCSRTRPLTLAAADLAALGRGDGGGIGAEFQV